MEPLTQYTAAEGAIDIAWGHPDPSLIPLAELREATLRAFDKYGHEALAYGISAGPPPLRQWIASRLAETDARAPTTDQIVVTGGTSQGLDLAATLLMEPGDLVLVSEPSYHIAIRMLAEDHRFSVVGVPSDDQGTDVDALARLVRAASRPKGRPAFLYAIPTFNNPTGLSLPDDRRRALADLIARENVIVLEDDTYRELAYDAPTPPSMWALAAPGSVVRRGSFAKSIAPGLRVGYLTVDAKTAERIALSGFLDSGGSPSHFTALVVAEYAAAGDFVRGIERFREGYRERRDALLRGLEEHILPVAPGTTWTKPLGGYFVWVELPETVDVTRLAEAAERCGTGFVPGRAFYIDKARAPNAIRLSFARYSPDDLVEAARRLGQAIESAAT
jgi:DNA-binding transcriptional MocR family regulator